MTDLEIKRLREAIYYYRKQRDNGKTWIPKSNSTLYVYCLAHGVDPVAVIEGTIPLPRITETPKQLNQQLDQQKQRFQVELMHLRNKKKLIFESKPWLPMKGGEFDTWCKENGIDVEELIDSDKNIFEVVFDPTIDINTRTTKKASKKMLSKPIKSNV